MLSRLAFRLIAVVLAASALSGSLTAQSFDLAAHGQQIIALDQLMRFHPGDDPTLAWANPALDDSSWPLIRGNETWYAQGYPKLTGFAWYRFKVTLPSHPGPLALWVPLIATNFQIYADGRLIAENGSMPPHPRPRYGPNLVFPIPADLAHSGQPLSFAIRVWHYQWEYELFGGLQEAMQLGDAGLIREWQAQRWRRYFGSTRNSTSIAWFACWRASAPWCSSSCARPTANFSGSACGRPSTFSTSSWGSGAPSIPSTSFFGDWAGPSCLPVSMGACRS